MVGAKLPIVVISECNNIWSGGLFIEDQNRITGQLIARGLDPNTLLYDPNRSFYEVTPYIDDFNDSHLVSAGQSARVTAWEDSMIQGFDLYTTEVNDSNFIPGEWFVIDYNAIAFGDCNIVFYDYNNSWTDPLQLIKLTNVPTRNLDNDANQNVSFTDFAVFGSQWLNIDCGEPNWCGGADLNRDGYVDAVDLGLFSEHWLWNYPTDYNTPQRPSDPIYTQDPNIIYRLCDVNGANEITIDVNESIRLYIDLTTIDDSNVSMFYVEADISNTALGWIDNTEYPSGTAIIHAGPDRDTFWDYWGPGTEQPEGIEFVAVTQGNPIDDGHLASFVYTAFGSGDVVLNLKNWSSLNTQNEDVFPTLDSILIHQVDTEQLMMGTTDSMETSSALQQEDLSTYNADELADWLDNLWSEEEIRQMYTKQEWDEFVSSVSDSN